MTDEIEARNYQEIERLNQRGGRTLSTVDLLEDGTLSVEMAAYLSEAVLNGASFLTAAGPGGVGKTTLLACLLGMMPPSERIVTVSGPDVLAAAARGKLAGPECFLAHEIGSGHWFGYIWGRQVPAFFGLVAQGRRIASCLHADTLQQVEDVLVGQLGVQQAQFAKVGLLLFMVARRARGRILRRVSAIYQWDDSAKEHRLVYEWDAGSDSFHARGVCHEPNRKIVDLWRGIAAEGVRDFQEVRRRYIHALTSGADSGPRMPGRRQR